MGWILLAACALLALALACAFLHEPRYAGLVRPPDRVRVFAHRGFGNHAPDNCLRGARMALAAGLDGIDIDSQLTRDGQLVVFHDLGVDHRTDGTGSVRDKTLAEMCALDLGRKYGGGFEGERVASVDDFLAAFAGGEAIVMIELKVPGLGASGVEERALELIRAHDAFEWVYLSSFNPLVLRRLKRLEPRVRTVFIFMDTTWTAEMLEGQDPEAHGGRQLPWALRSEPVRRAIRKLVKPDLLSINHAVHPRTIDRLQARGYPIFLWSLDTPAQIRAGLARRPYGIISDEMLLAKQLRDEAAA